MATICHWDPTAVVLTERSSGINVHTLLRLAYQPKVQFICSSYLCQKSNSDCFHTDHLRSHILDDAAFASILSHYQALVLREEYVYVPRVLSACPIPFFPPIESTQREPFIPDRTSHCTCGVPWDSGIANHVCVPLYMAKYTTSCIGAYADILGLMTVLV